MGVELPTHGKKSWDDLWAFKKPKHRIETAEKPKATKGDPARPLIHRPRKILDYVNPRPAYPLCALPATVRADLGLPSDSRASDDVYDARVNLPDGLKGFRAGTSEVGVSGAGTHWANESGHSFMHIGEGTRRIARRHDDRAREIRFDSVRKPALSSRASVASFSRSLEGDGSELKGTSRSNLTKSASATSLTLRSHEMASVFHSDEAALTNLYHSARDSLMARRSWVPVGTCKTMRVEERPALPEVSVTKPPLRMMEEAWAPPKEGWIPASIKA
jgi:hypothetical protein